VRRATGKYLDATERLNRSAPHARCGSEGRRHEAGCDADASGAGSQMPEAGRRKPWQAHPRDGINHQPAIFHRIIDH
jgi:hypothetical protein